MCVEHVTLDDAANDISREEMEKEPIHLLFFSPLKEFQ